MFNKQDLGKHLPDGKSAKDDFVAYFIVSGYRCSIWGVRKDWWAYKVRLDMGYTKHNKEVTLCLLLICVPGGEQNKTKQPLWVLPDVDEEQAWCLQRCTGSQLACPLVGLELKNSAGSAQGYYPRASVARVILLLHGPVHTEDYGH